MPLPNHVQEKRDEIVEQVIQDIQAGKPFFWDCEHYGKPAHNIAQGNLYHGLNRMHLIIASKRESVYGQPLGNLSAGPGSWLAGSEGREGQPYRMVVLLENGKRHRSSYWRRNQERCAAGPAHGQELCGVQCLADG